MGVLLGDVEGGGDGVGDLDLLGHGLGLVAELVADVPDDGVGTLLAVVAESLSEDVDGGLGASAGVDSGGAEDLAVDGDFHVVLVVLVGPIVVAIGVTLDVEGVTAFVTADEVAVEDGGDDGVVHGDGATLLTHVVLVVLAEDVGEIFGVDFVLDGDGAGLGGVEGLGDVSVVGGAVEADLHGGVLGVEETIVVIVGELLGGPDEHVVAVLAAKFEVHVSLAVVLAVYTVGAFGLAAGNGAALGGLAGGGDGGLVATT